jgi:hypothetical protein
MTAAHLLVRNARRRYFSILFSVVVLMGCVCLVRFGFYAQQDLERDIAFEVANGGRGGGVAFGFLLNRIVPIVLTMGSTLCLIVHVFGKAGCASNAFLVISLMWMAIYSFLALWSLVAGF